MKQIMVGGRLVTVPKGYMQAEALYTADEDKIFSFLRFGAKKEQARAEVLKKRIEFYDLYMAGKVSIPVLKPKKKTWRDWILYYLGPR